MIASTPAAIAARNGGASTASQRSLGRSDRRQGQVRVLVGVAVTGKVLRAGAQSVLQTADSRHHIVGDE